MKSNRELEKEVKASIHCMFLKMLECSDTILDMWSHMHIDILMVIICVVCNLTQLVAKIDACSYLHCKRNSEGNPSSPVQGVPQ